jgi:DNA-binding Xre family transcriptional regulator
LYVDILFEGLNRYFEDLAVTIGDILAFKADFLKYKRGDIHAEFW